MKVYRIEATGSYAFGVFVVAAHSESEANSLTLKHEEYNRNLFPAKNIITLIPQLKYKGDIPQVLVAQGYAQ